jgi:hypothetical protein
MNGNATTETRSATCAKCATAFDYVFKDRSRRVCDACIQANMKASLKRLRDREELKAGDRPQRHHTQGEVPEQLFKMTLQEAAARAGTTTGIAHRAMRLALNKIRKNPELKKLWRLYVSDGMPVPPPAKEVGEQLLEWQMELREWYRLYEDLICHKETEAEALECMEQIARFHAVLGKVVSQ